MVYLATFYWGWLLASLLLGLAMGWIAVVQRGEGVSRRRALAGGAGRRRWSRLAGAVVPGPLRLLARPRPDHVRLYLVGCAVGSWLRDWVVSRQRDPRPEPGGDRPGPNGRRCAQPAIRMRLPPGMPAQAFEPCECSKSVHLLSGRSLIY